MQNITTDKKETVLEDLTEQQRFEEDVKKGLTSEPKFLESKYFYDSRGSELFNRITELPEYYLTDCEREIIRSNAAAIAEKIVDEQYVSINVVELGAGDSNKPFPLIHALLDNEVRLEYIAIDISEKALVDLESRISELAPEINYRGMVSDYETALKSLSSKFDPDLPACTLMLFLGSNIGNLSAQESEEFLRGINREMNEGDYFLIGFDLKKSIETLVNAYSDPKKVTAEFNLNLLRRMNRELGANFNLDEFSHYACYNPQLEAMESYLISECEQQVYFSSLDETINFAAYEPIHTEYSHKYDLERIESLCSKAGFTLVENYSDPDSYFVNSLWVKPQDAVTD